MLQPEDIYHKHSHLQTFNEGVEERLRKAVKHCQCRVIAAGHVATLYAATAVQPAAIQLY
jgi:hypothetical protein